MSQEINKLKGNSALRPYIVLLLEKGVVDIKDYIEPKFWSEDLAHAKEQAIDAFPGCEILGITQTK